MAQIALFVVVYHILGSAAALLLDNWIRGNTYRSVIGLSFLALALSSCEMVPINAPPVPDVAAVIVQNETTKKHIKTFTGHTQRTKVHIDKSIEEGAKEQGNLQSVKKDLEELLGDPKQ